MAMQVGMVQPMVSPMVRRMNDGILPFPLCQIPMIDDLSFMHGVGPAVFTGPAGRTFVDEITGLVSTAALNIARFEQPAGFERPARLHEGLSTNEALHNRDFTDTVWVKSASMGNAKDAIGADGVANAASTLTANAANQTAFQPFTKASIENTYSIDIRRKTGTGAIEISDDGGTTPTDIALLINSITYTRFQITTTQANPSIGVEIIVSGDEIEVDYAQLEVQPGATSRIETGAFPVSRTAERMDIPVVNMPNGPADFSVSIDAAPLWIGTQTSVNMIAYGTGGEVINNRFIQIQSSNNFDWQIASTTVETDAATATTDMTRYVGTLDEGVVSTIYRNGAAQADTEIASRGVTTISTLSIGSQATLTPWFGHLRNFIVDRVALTAEQAAVR